MGAGDVVQKHHRLDRCDGGDDCEGGDEIGRDVSGGDECGEVDWRSGVVSEDGEGEGADQERCGVYGKFVHVREIDCAHVGVHEWMMAVV